MTHGEKAREREYKVWNKCETQVERERERKLQYKNGEEENGRDN